MAIKEVRSAYWGHPASAPGDRGVCLKVETTFGSARVFSQYFPDVWFTDVDDVEMGDTRVPLADFIEWLDAVRALAIKRRSLAEGGPRG